MSVSVDVHDAETELQSPVASCQSSSAPSTNASKHTSDSGVAPAFRLNRIVHVSPQIVLDPDHSSPDLVSSMVSPSAHAQKKMLPIVAVIVSAVSEQHSAASPVVVVSVVSVVPDVLDELDDDDELDELEEEELDELDDDDELLLVDAVVPLVVGSVTVSSVVPDTVTLVPVVELLLDELDELDELLELLDDDDDDDDELLLDELDVDGVVPVEVENDVVELELLLLVDELDDDDDDDDDDELDELLLELLVDVELEPQHSHGPRMYVVRVGSSITPPQ